MLFIPSVERDGKTSVDQALWTGRALEFLGTLFGGATAYPRAHGVWRDDDQGGHLVRDNPVAVHCYADVDDVNDDAAIVSLTRFCQEMGRATKQGEVGIVIGDEYLGLRDF